MEALSSLQEIKRKIMLAAERAHAPEVPELVAVSKFQGTDKILSLYQEGQRVFGENYVQELLEKKKELVGHAPDLAFHFIGRLQSNKVKALLPAVTTIHSVDSLKLVMEIEKRAAELLKPIEVYFQINIDHESSKGGFRVEELDALTEAVRNLKWVKPIGLMAIPDPNQDPTRAFQEMRELSQRFGETLGKGLSMGMSSDFERAIEMGSTSVRVGSALFGSRPKFPGA